MKQIQGIVMNVTEKGIVAMGNDGLFYRIPPQGNVPLIGEQIMIPIVIAKHSNRKSRFGKLTSQKMRKWSIAAAVLLMLVTSAIIYPLTPEAAYVVALEINPSLEMYMDDQNQVVKVLSLDDEARELVKDLDLKGLPLQDAMERVTLKAEEQGYFPSPDSRVFATVIQWDPEIEAAELEIEIEEAVQRLTLGEKVVVTSVDKDVLEEAHKEKLPVAKYQITRELEREGIELDKDQISKESVDQLLKKYQLDSDVLEKKKEKDDEKDKEQGEKKDKKDAKGNDAQDRGEKEKQRETEDSDKKNDKERENTNNARNKDKDKDEEDDKDKDNNNDKEKEKDKRREEAPDDESAEKDNPGASKKREQDGQKDEDSNRNDRVAEKDKEKANEREQDKKNDKDGNDEEKEDKD